MYLLLKPRKEKENYVKGEIMDIFGVLSFVGGLAMFLYGMSAMGDGLTKLSGGKLECKLYPFQNRKMRYLFQSLRSRSMEPT